MSIELWGAGAFGLVVGWITYRTLRRTETTGLSDLATVIGAVGGAAITGLFPEQTGAFGAYGIGLAIGFFGYFVTSLILASRTKGLSAVNEWLGGQEPTVGLHAPQSGVPNPVVLSPRASNSGIPPMP